MSSGQTGIQSANWCKKTNKTKVMEFRVITDNFNCQFTLSELGLFTVRLNLDKVECGR